VREKKSNKTTINLLHCNSTAQAVATGGKQQQCYTTSYDREEFFK